MTPPTTAISPSAKPTVTLAAPVTLSVPGGLDLAWPHTGQAAIAIVGTNQRAAYGDIEKPVPIASVTKTMTAYLILRHHPLASRQAGPSLTVTSSEAAKLPRQRALNQSLVPVRAGETFTERQALQALMLASADNMAEILARWDAGHEQAFVTEMNEQARQLGMAHTHFSQASGYLATSVSTATDLVKLGAAALKIPALADIAGQTAARMPDGTTVRNYNALIGVDGVNGIKTGSTTPAGGCLLFSARSDINGHAVTLVGAVLGQPGNLSTMLPAAFSTTRKLLRSAQRSLTRATVVPRDQVVAIRTSHGTVERLHPAADVTLTSWPGAVYHLRLAGSATAPQLEVRGRAGRLRATVPLTAAGAP